MLYMSLVLHFMQLPCIYSITIVPLGCQQVDATALPTEQLKNRKLQRMSCPRAKKWQAGPESMSFDSASHDLSTLGLK